VGSRADLDTVVKRKIPSPCRESNPRTQIVRSGIRISDGGDKEYVKNFGGESSCKVVTWKTEMGMEG
jgi:hypothetical protein